MREGREIPKQWQEKGQRSRKSQWAFYKTVTAIIMCVLASSPALQIQIYVMETSLFLLKCEGSKSPPDSEACAPFPRLSSLSSRGKHNGEALCGAPSSPKTCGTGILVTLSPDDRPRMRTARSLASGHSRKDGTGLEQGGAEAELSKHTHP